MKILVSGSLAYDKIMDFPGSFADHILPNKIHVLSVAFAVNDLKVNYGGTAGNIAYNLTLLNEKPKIVSTAGNDFINYKKWLLKHKMDLSGIKVIKNQPTASAHIVTDQKDNQITAFHPGAAAKSIAKGLKLNGVNYGVVAPGQADDMVKLPQMLERKHIPYVYDPGQQITMLSKNQLLSGINGAQVFISNDYELTLVLRKTRLTKNKLKKKVEILVTTLGEKGSIIEVGKKKYKIPPAKPKNTSDPTGAGDAYRAGFIKGMVTGMPLPKAGRLAGLVAVYTVEKYGTQTHKFTWQELEKRYKQNFKESL